MSRRNFAKKISTFCKVKILIKVRIASKLLSPLNVQMRRENFIVTLAHLDF